jgi:hypothetical protein
VGDEDDPSCEQSAGALLCVGQGVDCLVLPPDEAVKERYGEGVATPAVLVDQAHAAQGEEHLADVAVAEGLGEQSLRSLDDFLDRELAVGVVKVGDRPEQLALALGSTRPAAGEEVGVELARDGIERDRRGIPMTRSGARSARA